MKVFFTGDEFAFRFRHPEKVSQPVEVGRDRQGFELGGHAGDVTETSSASRVIAP